MFLTFLPPILDAGVVAPTITDQPDSIEVYEGQTATFTVAATGGGLAYQWQKSDNAGVDWSDISGATSSSYTTAATVRTTDNDDQFRCVVTNSAGTVNSNAATLTVWNPLALGADLACWLDPNSGVFTERTGASATTITTNGNPVGTWRARNGTINGTAPSDSARPTLRTSGLSGAAALEFDGSDDALSFLSNLASATQNTSYFYIYAGCSSAREASAGCLFFASNGLSAATTRVGLFFNQGSAGVLMAAGRRLDADSSANTSIDVIIDDAPIVAGARFLYGDSDLLLRENGTTIASNTSFQTAGSTSNTASLAVNIGSANAASYFDGLIGHVVIVKASSALSSTDLAKIEGFLTYKTRTIWGSNSHSAPYTSASATNTTIISPSGASITEGSLTSHRYRHHTRIYHDSTLGRTYVMHSSGGTNEDGSGQMAVMEYSDDDGATWSSPIQVLGAQSTWNSTGGAYENNKRVCFPRAFVTHDGSLYAIVAIDDTNGDPPASYGFEGVALIAREIMSDATLGTAFRISSASYTELDSIPVIAYDATLGPELYDYVKTYTWGGSAPDMLQSDWVSWIKNGSDYFTEPTAAIEIWPGLHGRFWRSLTTATGLLWAQWSTDGGTTWSTITRTDIPNGAVMQVKRLNNGKIALCGNVESTRATLIFAVFDPTDLSCSVRSIRSSVATTPVYAGTYKSGGAAYPDFVEVGTEIFASCSLQKENIGFSRFTL